MMLEIDDRLKDHDSADFVVVPVGVGSFAQSVVSHYKRPGRSASVITVEPDTAPTLWKSLSQDECVKVETSYTVMSGLDCGKPLKLFVPFQYGLGMAYHSCDGYTSCAWLQEQSLMQLLLRDSIKDFLACLTIGS
jgi:hypothetical protein